MGELLVSNQEVYQDITIPQKLIPVFEGEARYRGAYGGRGSGKTRTFALMTAVKAYQFAEAGTHGVILCGREFMNSLEESSLEEVKQAIRSVKWLDDYFEIGEKYVRTKNKRVRYIFTGLNRNLNSIKSKARVLLAWVDEAEDVSETAWIKLIPTVREDNSEIWVTWNPEKRNSATDKRFRKRENDKIVMMNYSDNPFFPDVLEQERLSDKANLSPEKYEWIWEGDYLDDSGLSKIRRSWINASIDAHKVLGFEASGVKVTGYDVADDGGDANATANRHGSILLAVDEWNADIDELLESCERAYKTAETFGSEIVYDSIGVGATAGAKFKELNDDPKNSHKKDLLYHKFVANGAVCNPEKLAKTGGVESQVKNKDKYASLKPQAWDYLADKFLNTYNAIEKGMTFDVEDLISIDSTNFDADMLEQIKSELSAPMEQKNSNDQMTIESKSDMKKRGVESPNVADAIVMAFAYHLVPKRTKQSYGSAGKRTY